MRILGSCFFSFAGCPPSHQTLLFHCGGSSAGCDPLGAAGCAQRLQFEVNPKDVIGAEAYREAVEELRQRRRAGPATSGLTFRGSRHLPVRTPPAPVLLAQSTPCGMLRTRRCKFCFAVCWTLFWTPLSRGSQQEADCIVRSQSALECGCSIQWPNELEGLGGFGLVR